MKRKTKSIMKILEEFPTSTFTDSGLSNDQWMYELDYNQFINIGKEINLSFFVDQNGDYWEDDHGCYKWIEAWLEPLSEEKNITAYCYQTSTGELVWHVLNNLFVINGTSIKRAPTFDIVKGKEE